MELVRERQVVERAQRRLAKLREGEAGETHGGPRYQELAALHVELHRASGVAPRQVGPKLVHPGPRLGAGRREIERLAGHLLQPEIPRRHHLLDVHVPLDQLDEGHEQLAVEAVLVELAGMHVGGRHHDHPGLEQCLEQAPEDHGIGDVRDVHLVEAQEPGIGGDRPRHVRDGVVLNRSARHREALRHVRHEGVEMGAAPAGKGGGLVEQVHQHGLAAADGAVDVKPLRRFGVGTRQEASEPGGQAVASPHVREATRQRCELGDAPRLGWIGGDRAFGEERLVSGCKWHGHLG